ncbi:Auxin responsive SAUR protein [Corchorus olitorius]|uniref:Auxin responsive SAUR protein n=1 Tax=Corchorus olitorius TaxID=93759 RepID=A0A1R3JDH3_9ROSI|nr:Auxin responsive SAUR protein [Corchorus olitorius]
MGVRVASMVSSAKQILKLRPLIAREKPDHVPKGHVAVYVGETQTRRFVVPISVVNHPSFKDLLKRAEEEFGFDHPMGHLTIPCREDTFLNLTSGLHA